MKIRRAVGFGVALAVFAAVATAAEAAVIFHQDYESGLTAAETVSGNFSINNSNAGNNGTLMMGHPGSYGNLAEDEYTLTVDLTGVSNALLAFDFVGSTEGHFDGFVMLANGGLLAPTSGVSYDAEGHGHSWIGALTLDGVWNAPVTFDLSGFDDSLVSLAWRFGSDTSVVGSGLAWDNLVVSGDLAVPEPASLVLLGLGLVGIGFSRRPATA